METTTPRINTIFFAICGLAFVPPCLFFTWYTVRLIWLNLTRADAAAYRSGGMLIGAIVFPLAAIIFGVISWYFLSKAYKGFERK